MNEKSREKELFTSILGKHIREKRLEKNFTLNRVAYETNIDEKHLGRLERGEKEPGAYTLGLIQIALNLNSADYLNEFITKKEE